MLRNAAQAPVTCGAAIDVPLLKPNPLPVTDELMDVPGASRLRKLAVCEKTATASPGRATSVVAPTLMALEMQPGAATPRRNVGTPLTGGMELLPAEITVAMPAARRLSMMSL